MKNTSSLPHINNKYILEFILTTHCNMRCDYCYIDNKGKNMSLETAYKAIHLFSPHKIIFFGGEPLLRINMIRNVVDYIKKSSVKIKEFLIVTNGTLINEAVIRFLKSNNIKIVISMDGNKRKHNLHRRYLNNEGTYDVILKNIFSLKDNGINPTVNYTVNPDTISGLADDLHALVKNNISINLGYIIDKGKITCQDRTAYTEELRRFAYIYLIRKLFLKNIFVGPFDRYFLKLLDQYNNIMTNSHNSPNLRCNLNKLTVCPEGDIYPCNICLGLPLDIQAKCSIGNIHSGIDFEKLNHLTGDKFNLYCLTRKNNFKKTNRLCLLYSKDALSRLQLENDTINNIMEIFSFFLKSLNNKQLINLRETCAWKNKILFH